MQREQAMNKTVHPAAIDDAVARLPRSADISLKNILVPVAEIRPRIQADLSPNHAALIETMTELYREDVNRSRDMVHDITRLVELQGSKTEQDFPVEPVRAREDLSLELKLDRIRRVAGADDVDVATIRELEKEKAASTLKGQAQLGKAHAVATYGHFDTEQVCPVALKRNWTYARIRFLKFSGKVPVNFSGKVPS